MNPNSCDGSKERILILRLPKPPVDIMFQSYPCHVFPEDATALS